MTDPNNDDGTSPDVERITKKIEEALADIGIHAHVLAVPSDGATDEASDPADLQDIELSELEKEYMTRAMAAMDSLELSVKFSAHTWAHLISLVNFAVDSDSAPDHLRQIMAEARDKIHEEVGPVVQPKLDRLRQELGVPESFNPTIL